MCFRMSKDFGSNGLRVGVVVSQHNKTLIKAFQGSALLMKISSPAVCTYQSEWPSSAMPDSHSVHNPPGRTVDIYHWKREGLDAIP